MFNCAWCNKKIGENEPLSAIDVKFRNGLDFSDQEGEIIPVYLSEIDRNVPMIVTTSDSEAKRYGQDGLFVVCSNECGMNLKAVLAREMNMFK
ncbi:hypothetical protein P5G51_015145 [Virgibacillus sp. 179-BFC.A HS]|uniref:Uncharacterized protein n=1 Tax=Tigheibacillus jepli TaxID=3035914 RepID=A0ABU5CJW0_9BACI|nr:hypothetical protein [Virgibacillus sp. 179-BFC.A HS]MDY0406520.1 hypothetical protein [Virgibacillus sp. 179-BFC.A HS]